MTIAVFTPPTWEAIRKRSEATTPGGLTHFCGDCFMTFRLLNGIPCTKHTLPDEQDWRAEVIREGTSGAYHAPGFLDRAGWAADVNDDKDQPHAFVRGKFQRGERGAQWPEETCEVCGRDPRNAAHHPVRPA